MQKILLVTYVTKLEEYSALFWHHSESSVSYSKQFSAC